MYLLSLYFQIPPPLDFSPLEAGLATLPATVGLVLVAPLVPSWRRSRRPPDDRHRVRRHHGRLRHRGLRRRVDGRTRAFLLPLVAIAVGMGTVERPASSAATASVPENQVGGASGVSNMARYVGAAVATALAATSTAPSSATRPPTARRRRTLCASGLAAASWMMAVFSFLGVLMAFVIGRHRAATRAPSNDAAAAAAAHTHTLPTSASGRVPGEQAPAPRSPSPQAGLDTTG